jgi:membrane dipeptidase
MPGRFLAPLFAATLLCGCDFLVGVADSQINRVVGSDEQPAATADPAFDAFFTSLFIADLHADALLWTRDLSRRQDRGHVDFARLCAGNVAFQVFSVPTRFPLTSRGADGRPYHDERSLDLIGLLWRFEVASRPWRSQWDLEQRALSQAADLHALASRLEAPRRLQLIDDVDDFATFLTAWKRSAVPAEQGPCLVGGILAAEGLQFVTGGTQALDRLFGAGFRMGGLTHHFDNPLAGSSTGGLRHGLTDAGRTALDRMVELGMAVDLAHASDSTIRGTTAAMRTRGRPVPVSHTGIQRHCATQSERNISDEGVRDVALTGGIVGVIYGPGFVCRRSGDPRARIIGGIVEAMNAIDDLLQPLTRAGGCATACVDDPADHIAFGSDWDGAISSPIDAAGMRLLVAALRAERAPACADAACRRYSDEQIRKIAGRNVCRVIAASLPEGSAEQAAALCRDLAREARRA